MIMKFIRLGLVAFLSSSFCVVFPGKCSNKIDEELTHHSSNWGKKIGILTPATNLTLEHELWSMRVENATIATARILIDKVEWNSEKDLEVFVKGVISNIPDTARQLQQVKPDSLLLGISISNLWGGLESNKQIKSQIKEETGLELYTPVDAMQAALEVFGVKKISVVTPYPEIADKKVEEFYQSFGVTVVRQKGLRCKSAIEIGEVLPATIESALKEVNVDGIDAITVLGTDLKAAKVAAECEKSFGKPIISVNASTWWYALRQNGIETKLSGFGRLFEEH